MERRALATRRSANAGRNDALAAALEAIAGVRRAWIDDDGVAWVVVQSGADRDRVRAEADRVAAQNDHAGLAVRVAAIAEDTESVRVRFEGIERTVARDGSVHFRVRVAWRGETASGEAAGEGGEPVEMRHVVRATLAALEAATGETMELRLVGAKRVHAFDADFVVVSFLRSGTPRHLVGAVWVAADVYHSAALAVLDALNRVLATRLAAKEQES